MEENSVSEESLIDRLRAENKSILKSYDGMIDLLQEKNLKIEKQARRIKELEQSNELFIEIALEGKEIILE